MNSARLANFDLDFFTSEIVHWRGRKDPRPTSKDTKPWPVGELRDFLESKCGLSRTNRIPGRFGTNHDAAFDYMKELVSVGDRKIILTHIDAHADQGLGDSGWVYLMEELLHDPKSMRGNPRRASNGMNLANYIAFAVACGWIEEIEMVVHPKGGGDFMPYHFRNFDPTTGVIELKGYPKGTHTKALDIPDIQPLFVEPPVPFRPITLANYSALAPFDCAFLAHSPNYTPRSADRLIGVFSDYVDFK